MSETLQFKCPKCGNDTFGLRQNREVFIELELIDDSIIDVVKEEEISVSCETLECIGCETVFLNGDKDTSITVHRIFEWIEKNCPKK